MGKVIVKVKLENGADLVRAGDGTIAPEQVRRCEIDALADTGASMMCLPEEVVEQLGLEVYETRPVRLATGVRHNAHLARTLHIEIGDRALDQNCVVLPRGTQALIGQLVLQGMDLVVDCSEDRLAPGHPEADGPVYDLL